jgi:hypothetical protein
VTAPHRPARLALGAWAALILATVVWGRPHAVAYHVGAAPLAGAIDPRASLAVLPAVAVAVAALAMGPSLAERLTWRRLLAVTFTAALVWAVVLAAADGSSALTAPLRTRWDYLHDLHLVRGPHAFLMHFVERNDHFTTHVAAHPPGMMLVLWALARAGVPGAGPAAALIVATGASAAAAALVALRALAGEDRARAAAPFVAFAPAAVWVATSADGLFMAVAAWAIAAFALACGDRSPARWALVSGALFGMSLNLSYGIGPLGVVLAAIAVGTRRVRPLAVACGAAMTFVAVGAASGFWWPAGLAATRARYARGVAALRPYPFFAVANLAAFATALGPAVAAGLVRLRDRRVWLLTGATLCAVAIADISGLSKGEVERIWLPFAPWVTVACCALHDRLRRWLGLQIAWALAVQALVRTPW